MKLSEISRIVEPSFTRQLFNIAMQYDDVIDFTLGDPDFITPEYIRQAACNTINSGKTHYSVNAGLIELRKTISRNVEEETGIEYKAEGEVIVTVGAMEALYLSLLCILDEGDEVIIPAPYWVNYKHMVQMCHANPVILQSDESSGFIVSAEDIRNSITPNTRAIIINSPNNPSGAIYDRKTLDEICDIVKKNDLIVFWDECYKHIVYDGNKVPNILDIPDMKKYCVIINSFSKAYSMTGWRIGYALAPADLIAAMTKLQENLVACASLPSQYAAIAALKNSSNETQEMVKTFKHRRDILVNGINCIDNLSCEMPQSTFYALINISKSGLSSEEFAMKLIREKHVAVVPGITYGMCCDSYVRVAYTVNEDKIKEGLKRIKDFMEGL